MKMEPIKCSETSAFSTQTPGRYPKENALHTKHGESLKSRKHDEAKRSLLRTRQKTWNAKSSTRAYLIQLHVLIWTVRLQSLCMPSVISLYCSSRTIRSGQVYLKKNNLQLILAPTNILSNFTILLYKHSTITNSQFQQGYECWFFLKFCSAFFQRYVNSKLIHKGGDL